eukprot:TRINITY_DN51129_c0_g1_i2.p1 TRINITY_DN51129_c0_g1~~TRINITY_DN51129_c0_g1_i2.p1  ORF type:complete len:250 (-),score=20.31 TRINITY_DN51129_c0_g1_i2:7-699(-)
MAGVRTTLRASRRSSSRTNVLRHAVRGDRSPPVAGVALAAWLMVAQPDAAHALMRNNLPECTNFTTAAGIEYCDSVRGKGSVPEAGDQIVVDYTAVAVDNGKVYAGSRQFSFVVGEEESLIIEGWTRGILGTGDELPAVQRGGIRTIRIPAELAFGELGDGCMFGRAQNCQVPPKCPVQITFQYFGRKFQLLALALSTHEPPQGAGTLTTPEGSGRCMCEAWRTQGTGNA